MFATVGFYEPVGDVAVMVGGAVLAGSEGFTGETVVRARRGKSWALSLALWLHAGGFSRTAGSPAARHGPQ